MTNKTRSTIYIGVTNDLVRRVSEHQSGATPGFTEKYHLDRLVYYEVYPEVLPAIDREKQLKHWTRRKKDQLIATMNPTWMDLRPEIFSGMKPIDYYTKQSRDAVLGTWQGRSFGRGSSSQSMPEGCSCDCLFIFRSLVGEAYFVSSTSLRSAQDDDAREGNI